MKIGFFGGSFNPPHICHALVCHYVLATADIDCVLAVPCFQHPFGKPMASFKDRVAMCKLAFEHLGLAVEVSEIEAEREGPSFTVDTLQFLRQRRPNDEFRLLIGSDIVDEARKWKDFPTVERLARPLIVARGAGEFGRGDFVFPDISSTLIREMIAGGEWPDKLVQRRVLEHIRRRGLYGSIGAK